MMFSRRQIFWLGLLGASGLGLSRCSNIFPWTWKQKLTLTVTTPQGEVTGSAVTSVKWFNAGPQFKATVAGEAVVVDLGQREYLFALMASPKGDSGAEYMSALSSLVFYGSTEIRRGSSRDEKFTQIKNTRGARAVPLEQCPMLVMFGDIKDPKSVKQVKPESLSAAFGQGYALKAVTLEITNEPVTEGEVEKVLGWIGPFPEPPLCKPTSQTDFSFCAAKIHHGDFVRKFSK